MDTRNYIPTDRAKQLLELTKLMGKLDEGKISGSDLSSIESIQRLLDELKASAEANEKEPSEGGALVAEGAQSCSLSEEPYSAELSSDWDDLFSDVKEPEGEAPSYVTPADALVLSLNKYARVNMEYVAERSGRTVKECVLELGDAVFQNPEGWSGLLTDGWETRDEYLSGNIYKKLEAAKAANQEYRGCFDSNIKALRGVLSGLKRSEDIYVTLGTPWLPTDVIDDFITALFDSGISRSPKGAYRTKHDLITGTWEIPAKSRCMYGRYRVRGMMTYGTSYYNALEIIERTMNMRSVAVYDTHTRRDPATGKETTYKVLNEIATLNAEEKQRLILEEFSGWIFKSAARRKRLYDIFYERYGCVCARRYDGSYLTLPGLKSEVKLYPYQKNAIARILTSKNTLLAHEVGAGKTYIMAVAGMELRRMGISKKNLYVVPNSITGQWRDAFSQLYDNPSLLVVNPSAFTPDKRQDTLAKIRDFDFDAIIMAASCFEQIPISNDYLLDRLAREQKEVEDALADPANDTAGLRRRRKTLEGAAKKLEVTLAAACAFGISFNELGIGMLFVDEAHNYKNISLETKMLHVLGVNTAGSNKCDNMLAKVHAVQSATGGRGVVFATGTPITNSVSDIFTMQRYLQNGMLELMDLSSFDSWVGMFAERRCEFEVDVDTQGFRMATRLCRFHNIPELTNLFATVTDFYRGSDSDELPDFDGYTDALVSRTPELSDFLNIISSRADDVRHGRVNRKIDNMLKITTDGRKAALDIRLVDDALPRAFSSKVYRCAENIADVYQRTNAERGAQLVFCDSSTPKEGFNIYDELRDILVGFGIPDCEIAYVHDATTEKKRARLFADTNSGAVRVLIGSTFKLGTGVNVQERLVALHHLDVPWRPADMVQREGRILRQGNTSERVQIFRYITEGSFDAYSWQLLETKQRFIEDILSGFVTETSSADIGDTSLDYGEVKALAVGNPLIKERIEVTNSINRLKALLCESFEHRERVKAELAAIPAAAHKQEEIIAVCKRDIGAVAEFPREEDEKKRVSLRRYIFDEVSRHRMEIEEKLVCEYRGLKVIAPAKLTQGRLYVWLEREGRYYLELGDTDGGVLIRLDNFIDRFGAHLEKLEGELRNLRHKSRALKRELASGNDYEEQLEALREKLAEIDGRLGINTED